MVTFVGMCMEFLRIVLTLTRPYSDKVLDFIYRWFVIGTTRELPVIDDKILMMSATQLARRIRKRKLSCQSVVASYIRRIEGVNPLINACTDQRYDAALQEASLVDAYLDRTTKSLEEIEEQTPLLGVPFTCKESVGVKGMSMTKGLVHLKGRLAPSDADAVLLMKKAGAIALTVTNVPILCMWWESANHINGMTRNPYDNRRTVGGSSGGESALIAAACAVIGIGTDIAGSIRIPASFCGIYGHKPSRGIISVQEPWPGDEEDIGNLDQFCSTGPMCRYAEDLRLLTEVLAGETIVKVNWNLKVDFRMINVFYMEELPGRLLAATPDIKAAVLKAVKHFEDKFGITAVKLDCDFFRYAFYIWESKLLEAGSVPFSEVLSEGRHVGLLMEFLKSLLQKSDYTWPALYFATVDRRERDEFYNTCLIVYKLLEDKMVDVFNQDAILIMPTHPEPPPHYLMTIPKYPNIGYTCIFNVLGFPSTQVPAGFSNGLPIGIQVVSSLNNDNLTIDAAVELDSVFKGWTPPCQVTV